MKYRTKIKTVEAIQWNGSNCKEVLEFVGHRAEVNFDGQFLTLKTIPDKPKFNMAYVSYIDHDDCRHVLYVKKGDYTTYGQRDPIDLYPKDIFEYQYEPSSN